MAAPQSMHTGSTCVRSYFAARDERVAEARHCNLLNIKVEHYSGGQTIMLNLTSLSDLDDVQG